MSPEHPLCQKRMGATKDLQGLEFIAFEKDIPTAKQLMKFWQILKSRKH